MGELGQLRLVTMEAHDARTDAFGIRHPLEQPWSFAARSDHQEGVAP
jgi:hypothetical protein